MNMRSTLCALFLVLGALFISGCQTTIQDLTPERLQANPSGIYTFRMKTNFQQTNIVPGTVEPLIVIGGEKHRMRPSPLGENYYEFEYRVPPNVRELKYYYEVHYLYTQDGVRRPSVKYSTFFNADGVTDRPHASRLINRYVIQLETTRGPVGSRIALVGRGFSEFDRIVIGDVEAPTNFESQNAISFVVPSLPAGRVYPVSLRTGEGDLPAGEFRVDPASIIVQPGSLRLQSGQSELLTFRITTQAPATGLVIDVTTDIPESVIMPEVVIPSGQRTVSVPVEAGSPGRGNLWVNSEGFDEVRIPITVE